MTFVLTPSTAEVRRRQPFVIRDAHAISLLASPIRQAILDCISASGPASIAGLSRQLRRPADRLYYHVRLLEKAGLVVDAGSGRSNRRAEATFDVPGRPMLMKYLPMTPRNRRAIERVIAAVLRSARRDFSRALTSARIRVEGRDRELWAGRIEANLTAGELTAINALLEEILRSMARPRPPAERGRKSYQVTWVTSPSR